MAYEKVFEDNRKFNKANAGKSSLSRGNRKKKALHFALSLKSERNEEANIVEHPKDNAKERVVEEKVQRY